MPKTIDELYAFVVLDPTDETEGIPTWSPEPGVSAPVIGSDHDRVVSMREYVQQMATALQLPMTLVRFSQREELEVIEPGERTEPKLERELPAEPAEDAMATGWVDAPDFTLIELGDDDIDLHEGVVVLSTLIDGKPTLLLKFLKEGDPDSDDSKPIALRGQHAEMVGPLAIAAWTAAVRALQQQQN